MFHRCPYCFFLLGAAAPSWLALLPPNVKGPKGGYVWYDKQIVDWVNGPTPTTV
jgi:carbonyl reductase 1